MTPDQFNPLATDRPTYDPVEYWTRRGAREPQIEREPGEVEAHLQSIFARLTLTTVLDVGCGDGRLYPLLPDPKPHYTGLDLSIDRLVFASRRAPKATLIRANFLDFVRDFIPGDFWNLVIASEVLMHVPPEQVMDFVRALRLCGDRLVTVDWTANDVEPSAHVFAHDYPDLFINVAKGRDPIVGFTDIGRQTIYEVEWR